ncbi:hypothetical protein L1987_06386 [Smallanthus sonchifolius]|uniref:Uncharacterized protein n=1 Tax=Smallanthus sonchifolius TaxID=185202 RepID=A0ACB9JY76_9ASTR|nr:hypothetical protein L1987_06386 [Smallanthus sonchifolius]
MIVSSTQDESLPVSSLITQEMMTEFEEGVSNPVSKQNEGAFPSNSSPKCQENHGTTSEGRRLDMQSTPKDPIELGEGTSKDSKKLDKDSLDLKEWTTRFQTYLSSLQTSEILSSFAALRKTPSSSNPRAAKREDGTKEDFKAYDSLSTRTPRIFSSEDRHWFLNNDMENANISEAQALQEKATKVTSSLSITEAPSVVATEPTYEELDALKNTSITSSSASTTFSSASTTFSSASTTFSSASISRTALVNLPLINELKELFGDYVVVLIKGKLEDLSSDDSLSNHESEESSQFFGNENDEDSSGNEQDQSVENQEHKEEKVESPTQPEFNEVPLTHSQALISEWFYDTIEVVEPRTYEEVAQVSSYIPIISWEYLNGTGTYEVLRADGSRETLNTSNLMCLDENSL